MRRRPGDRRRREMISAARPESVQRLLDDLEPLFLSSAATPDRWAAVQAARARAESLAHSEMGAAGAHVAVTVFLADALCALVLERSWTADEVEGLVERAAELTRLPVALVRAGTYLRLLRDPALLELPPHVALEAELKLFLLFTSATEASLWVAGGVSGPLRCLAAVGAGKPGPRARAVARRTLEEGEREDGSGRGWFHGVLVRRWQQPCGALVIRARPEDRARTLSLARETAAVLTLILEKDILIRRSSDREQKLVEATERRLARLGFDLHDGPLQDVAALAGELRHFRRQLPRLLAAEAPVDRVLGRIDDIEARLFAADRDLRELAHSFESPAVLQMPFPRALREEVDAFSRRTDIPAQLRLEGDFRRLTGSQRIAIFRIVQEALTNVREHSRASELDVSLVASQGHVRLEIRDNGRGFDVEATLIRAARRGRLGLVGMNERVRLLGGVFSVQSRPRGPTTISVTLPEWHPLPEEQPEGGQAFDVADRA